MRILDCIRGGSTTWSRLCGHAAFLPDAPWFCWVHHFFFRAAVAAEHRTTCMRSWLTLRHLGPGSTGRHCCAVWRCGRLPSVAGSFLARLLLCPFAVSCVLCIVLLRANFFFFPFSLVSLVSLFLRHAHVAHALRRFVPHRDEPTFATLPLCRVTLSLGHMCTALLLCILRLVHMRAHKRMRPRQKFG